MDDWGITISKNTTLYKGVVKDSLNEKYKKSCWFSFDKDIADEYAKTYAIQKNESELYQIELQTNLKLINILDLKFRVDFWNKCTMLFNDNDTKDERKIKALIPLGIPDLETQNIFSRKTDTCNDYTKAWAKLVGGHRCSSFDTDEWMVKVMKDIYENKYDGYILPFNVPTCFHDNDHFAREICIFEPILKIKNSSLIQYYKYGGKPKTGGSNKILRRDELTLEEWDKMSDELYEACGYTGPFEYKNGIRQAVGYEKLLESKLNKMFNELPKEKLPDNYVPPTILLHGGSKKKSKLKKAK